MVINDLRTKQSLSIASTYLETMMEHMPELISDKIMTSDILLGDIKRKMD